ncbi:glycosyltransferase family 4 protein [Psychroserpens burtonensis]|uniref:glycosyltransferase family 4 protein n=1 Tax=Psychroserpens burtonensis TaxID=49278 RepID=UPI0012FCD659|nr:glycosyltransferase family 4 protein [Psychroserpens burtonensis]
MKILLFHTYNRGYLSSFFHELSVKLFEDGHEVVSFSFKSTVSERLIDDVKVIVKKKKGYFTNYTNVYRIVRQEKPDVILSNFSYVNPALLFGKLLGVKHNMVWFHTLKKQMDFKWYNVYIKSKFLNLASDIITNSIELKNEVITDYRQKSIKVHNFPFTTAVSSTIKKEINLDKIDGKVYIGCPGRLHPDKNQKVLLEVLDALKNDNYVVVFVGAVQNNFLFNHVLYEAYKDQILHLGTLSKEEMADFYFKMDLIVLPSLNEAFGLVLIEALASGCNTLVSNRFGALDYIKEDVSHMTFSPLDVVDLKNKIIDAFTYKKPSQYFKALYANNFSMSDIIKMLLLLIKK